MSKTTKGNKWIRAMLTQCALCASRSKKTYLKDKFYRLVARRGKKKASIAIGRKILVSAYYMLRNRIGYKELGADYLDKRNKTKALRYYKRRIENLGFEVLLAERAS